MVPGGSPLAGDRGGGRGRGRGGRGRGKRGAGRDGRGGGGHHSPNPCFNCLSGKGTEAAHGGSARSPILLAARGAGS
eukprot:204432-Prymnesium_polylepis.2